MLSKNRLKVRLEFGRHTTRGDAKGLRRAIAEFKPNIFVAEYALIPEDIRKGKIQKLNSEIEEARKSDSAKQSLLEKVGQNNGFSVSDKFLMEQMEIIISTPNLPIYIAEDCTEDEFFARSTQLIFMLYIPHPIHLAAMGKIDEAIHKMDYEFHGRNDFYIFERNRRVAAGFERLLTEAEELFPGIEKNPSINVLLRYGTNHLGMQDRLQELGFDVVMGPLPPLSMEEELIRSLNADPARTLTADESIRMLFVISAQAALGDSLLVMDDAKYVEQLRSAFERVGYEQGFVRFLRSRAPTAPDQYFAEIKTML